MKSDGVFSNTTKFSNAMKFCNVMKFCDTVRFCVVLRYEIYWLLINLLVTHKFANIFQMKSKFVTIVTVQSHMKSRCSFESLQYKEIWRYIRC